MVMGVVVFDYGMWFIDVSKYMVIIYKNIQPKHFAYVLAAPPLGLLVYFLVRFEYVV